MAKPTSGGLGYPTDQIRVDTSHAPWMKIAFREEGKNIRELAANDEFVKRLRTEVTFAKTAAQFDQQMESFRQKSLLLKDDSSGHLQGAKLMRKTLTDPTEKLLKNMESSIAYKEGTTKLDPGTLKRLNPEIDKYFKGVKTDPSYDKKKRSWDIDSTHKSDKTGFGQVTAWCAAFVNWCLSEAGAPRLGYATAKSWLQFGTPIVHPVYGCIIVMKPSKATGSSTGHVAFFVESIGKKVSILGGNQDDRVSVHPYDASRVVGYRWPTSFNHYLAADGRQVLV